VRRNLGRGAATRARRTASVCSGAFIVAPAGLLDGATTHWNCVAEFAHAYPRVRVEPDRIFIRDGALWTSAGITAGLDLAVALIGSQCCCRDATALHRTVTRDETRNGMQQRRTGMQKQRCTGP
jgi:transcriptional regulator GlxA family with amidase domain